MSPKNWPTTSAKPPTPWGLDSLMPTPEGYMTPEEEALGKRALLCKGWKWMAGMLARCDRLVVEDQDEGQEGCWYFGDEGCQSGFVWPSEVGRLPQFADVATLGCLLHLVREAWEVDVWTVPSLTEPGKWTCSIRGHRGYYASSEAEVLVRALEGHHRGEPN